MSKSIVTGETTAWKGYEKVLFRIAFIYLLLQALPLDWKTWSYLFSVNWLHLGYQDIFNLAHYTTRFSAAPAAGYADWGILLAIAVVGGVIWTYRDANRTAAYDGALYWLRVILRYRLALAILAYGFVKFFPLLAPYPSLSQLNTPYGHFTRWKLFSLSLGIVPSYELFLGLVEIIIAFLLLYRKTASIGAFIFLIFCGNIFMSNLAYEGGDQVYSLLLISFALAVLSPDINRIVRLLILQQPASPNTFRWVFTDTRQRYVRIFLKTAFVLFFVVIYGIKTGVSAKSAALQYPSGKGLPGIAGLYNVKEFRVNGNTLPYSLTDSVRWQNVVFEEWNTLSIRSNRPVKIDTNNQHYLSKDNDKRLYELEGANWRHYYTYTVDTLHQLLLLKNRNPHYQQELWALHYRRPDSAQVVLSGLSPDNDTVFVKLEKLPKKYLLEEAAKGSGRSRKLTL